MKRIVLLLIAIVMIAGCTGLQINNQQAASVGMKIVAYDLGYLVGEKYPQADPQLRSAYTLARTGQLPPEQINAALAELKLRNPVLMGNCMILIEAMGAGIAPTGQVIDIKSVTPEMWDAVARYYVQGFNLAKAR